MYYVKIVLTSIGSFVALFLLTKLTGKKQVGELTMFDYVNGITIGSIAAEMATSEKWDFIDPLIAMFVYALSGLAISVMSMKSLRMRKFFTGSTELLYKNGKIYNCNLKHAKIDIAEFLSQLRVNGYFDLNDVSEVYLETNGRFSIVPAEKARPATPSDLKLSPKQTKPAIVVVSDGEFIPENLSAASIAKETVISAAKAAGALSTSDIFLATADSSGKVSVYLKNREILSNDIFQ